VLFSVVNLHHCVTQGCVLRKGSLIVCRRARSRREAGRMAARWEAGQVGTERGHVLELHLNAARSQVPHQHT